MKLDIPEHWDKFAEDLQVPQDMMMAFASIRSSLVKMVKPRPLSAEEHKVYLEIIRVLLETVFIYGQDLKKMGALLDEVLGAEQATAQVLVSLSTSLQEIKTKATNWRNMVQRDEQEDESDKGEVRSKDSVPRLPEVGGQTGRGRKDRKTGGH